MSKAKSRSPLRMYATTVANALNNGLSEAEARDRLIRVHGTILPEEVDQAVMMGKAAVERGKLVERTLAQYLKPR